MIISASRRTDIPAFYAAWLINRIRQGFCQVSNPYRPGQVKRVSLLPGDVDVIVFWTRHALPLLPYLDELDQRGIRYYFQYSFTAYPRQLESSTPTSGKAIETIRELSNKIGSQRVVWRYDPIYLSESTSPDFHYKNFKKLAQALSGYSQHCVISLYDAYAKSRSRLGQNPGFEPLTRDREAYWQAIAGLLPDLAAIAADHQFQLNSCAEARDWVSYGIQPGKCIDDDLIKQLFGLDLVVKKDPGQRTACGCVLSQDIGRYDTCMFGCQYCYATRNFEQARRYYATHDANLASL